MPHCRDVLSNALVQAVPPITIEVCVFAVEEEPIWPSLLFMRFDDGHPLPDKWCHGDIGGTPHKNNVGSVVLYRHVVGYRCQIRFRILQWLPVLTK